jgi:signal transduction histidine kinase
MVNEKLSVVGKWARHDARNKLAVIKSNAYLAKKKLPNEHINLKYLGEIESACDQIVTIFDFASAYEMLGMEERSFVDVEKSIEEAVTLSSGLRDVKVMNDCRGLTVLADSQLRQLFHNMIANSLMHGEKVSRIRVYYEDGKEALKLVYEDDGVGISDDVRCNLFKEGCGRGSGHGLYFTAKLCKMYGWAILETGKYGKGAQFTITIPKMHEKVKTTKAR